MTTLIVLLIQIKSLGAKAGVVLNPGTPLTAIEYILDGKIRVFGKVLLVVYPFTDNFRDGFSLVLFLFLIVYSVFRGVGSELEIDLSDMCSIHDY